jgi:hypothetical protein
MSLRAEVKSFLENFAFHLPLPGNPGGKQSSKYPLTLTLRQG